MQDQEQTENDMIFAKLCKFGRDGVFQEVIVIEEPSIERVLQYVHSHSLGKDSQIGIVWIKDGHGALHYGLLHKGQLVNDLLKLDDGTQLEYQSFRYVQPVSSQLIRHISTPYERAFNALEAKPKLIP